jgi:hypothetical protein
MINIDKDFFVERVIASYKYYSKQSGIPAINSDIVSEFKLNKKFVYRLNKVASDADGLIKVHERLLNNFLNKVPLNAAAKAYVPKKSYLDFLEPHRNNYYFIRTDLKNFFHSISRKLLIDSFSPYFKDEYTDDLKKQKLISAFLKLISYKVPNTSENETFSNKYILPMGFKTSPAISNIVFRKFDILIEDYCSQHHITYTRYADDMLFSSKAYKEEIKNPFINFFKSINNEKVEFIHSKRFLEELSILVKIGGFKLNKNKTIKAINTISLNGYTVEGSNYSDRQGTIRISNKKTNIIGKLLYELNKKTTSEIIMRKLFKFKVSDKYFRYKPVKREFIEEYCKDQINNKLIGYRSYLISILKYNNEYGCIDAKYILKYEKLVSDIENLI